MEIRRGYVAPCPFVLKTSWPDGRALGRSRTEIAAVAVRDAPCPVREDDPARPVRPHDLPVCQCETATRLRSHSRAVGKGVPAVAVGHASRVHGCGCWHRGGGW